jgi:hypothetical protein
VEWSRPPATVRKATSGTDGLTQVSDRSPSQADQSLECGQYPSPCTFSLSRRLNQHVAFTRTDRRLEQLVLCTVLRLGDHAYGVRIVDELRAVKRGPVSRPVTI